MLDMVALRWAGSLQGAGENVFIYCKFYRGTYLSYEVDIGHIRALDEL